MGLGATNYSSVTWTTGDTITEAKLDAMVANDQAYDSHASNGLLLNNNTGLYMKDSGGTSKSILNIDSSDVLTIGNSAIITQFAGINDGWLSVADTWTYASADDPTYTFTISGDKTSTYSVGMKVKLTQTTVKYFVITKVTYSAPNTTVTVYGGTDYDLANENITNPFVSRDKCPVGFPMEIQKWDWVKTKTTSSNTINPVTNTWYNHENIILPIGDWHISYQCDVGIVGAGAGRRDIHVTLSTANNSESSTTNTARMVNETANHGIYVNKEFPLNLTSKTTYYLNYAVKEGTATNAIIGAGAIPTVIRARLSYIF